MRTLRILAVNGVFLLGFGLGAVALVACAVPVAALAQSAAAPVTTIDAGALFGDWTSLLERVAVVVASAIVALLSWGIHRLVGVNIDAKMRATLQGALENAAHVLIASAQGGLYGKTLDVKSPAVAAAIQRLRKFIPDTLKHFGLSDDAIVQLLSAYVAKLLPKGA